VYDYDKIIIESRTDAEAVLAQLDDLISQYGRAAVADLYTMVGVTHNFTDNDYGWFNISEARVAPAIGGGYYLRLPAAEPLNK
jgi:hypothetical protein